MKVAGLVKQAKKGNKEALLQLILAEKDAYYRLALTYTGDEHDAMDALEEMIVILYEKIHQLRKADSFYGWSKTILANHCKALIRKRKKLSFIDEWEEEHHPDNGNGAVRDPYGERVLRMDIQRALEFLNDHQREAIRLKYFHDLDYGTIAKIMDVSVGTAKSRVFQGLKKLREIYGGEPDESN